MDHLEQTTENLKKYGKRILKLGLLLLSLMVTRTIRLSSSVVILIYIVDLGLMVGVSIWIYKASYHTTRIYNTFRRSYSRLMNRDYIRPRFKITCNSVFALITLVCACIDLGGWSKLFVYYFIDKDHCKRILCHVTFYLYVLISFAIMIGISVGLVAILRIVRVLTHDVRSVRTVFEQEGFELVPDQAVPVLEPPIESA